MDRAARPAALLLALLLLISSAALCACGGSGAGKTDGEQTKAETLWEKDKETLEKRGYSVTVETDRSYLSPCESGAGIKEGALNAFLIASKEGAADISAYYFVSKEAAIEYHSGVGRSGRIKGVIVTFGDPAGLLF